MKRIVDLLYIVLIMLIFLYIQSQYIIDSVHIEQDLGELSNGEISIIQSFQIEQTKSTVVIFKSTVTIGYVILTKHPFMDKLKVTRLQNDIEEKNAYIVTTNRGNYIVATGNLNDNLIVLNNKKTVEMNVLSEEFNMYISADTIPKKYIDKDILD